MCTTSMKLEHNMENQLQYIGKSYLNFFFHLPTFGTKIKGSITTIFITSKC